MKMSERITIKKISWWNINLFTKVWVTQVIYRKNLKINYLLQGTLNNEWEIKHILK